MTVPAAGGTTYTTQIAGWQMGRPPVRHSTRTREVTILSDSFAIPQLRRRRRVWLYLPPGYATSKRHYPVLYMHDGQNDFDDSTSFTGEWGVDEALDSLHAHGGPDAIVVAVDHGGARRLDEYDPWRNPNPRFGGGEGDAYVDFLIHTLKPYVDAHYRTLRDPAHTGIMGSSMGGLISLYATLTHPDVFGRAGVFSCACWIADPQIFQLARSSHPSQPLAHFYFVAGGQETADGSQGRDQARVVDSLRAAGFPASVIHASVPPDGRHSEWFWRREFPAAFVWLFGPSR